MTPEGRPFFSMGINHIDPATMRYPENIDLGRNKYGGSTIKWIREFVEPNLKHWGFNSIGWVQEVAVRKWQHSRAFTPEEYQALNMPYCHLLPFTELSRCDIGIPFGWVRVRQIPVIIRRQSVSRHQVLLTFVLRSLN